MNKDQLRELRSAIDHAFCVGVQKGPAIDAIKRAARAMESQPLDLPLWQSLVRSVEHLGNRQTLATDVLNLAVLTDQLLTSQAKPAEVAGDPIELEPSSQIASPLDAQELYEAAFSPAEAPHLDIRLVEPAIAAIAGEEHSHDSIATHDCEMCAVADRYGRSLVPALTRMIVVDRNTPGDGRCFYQYLRLLGDAAIPVLHDTLRGSGAGTWRRRAAICRMGDLLSSHPEWEDDILAAAQLDPDTMEAEVALALRGAHSDGALHFLIGTLEQTQRDDSRRAAAAALAQLQHPRVVDELFALLDGVGTKGRKRPSKKDLIDQQYGIALVFEALSGHRDPRIAQRALAYVALYPDAQQAIINSCDDATRLTLAKLILGDDEEQWDLSAAAAAGLAQEQCLALLGEALEVAVTKDRPRYMDGQPVPRIVAVVDALSASQYAENESFHQLWLARVQAVLDGKAGKNLGPSGLRGLAASVSWMGGEEPVRFLIRLADTPLTATLDADDLMDTLVATLLGMTDLNSTLLAPYLLDIVVRDPRKAGSSYCQVRQVIASSEDPQYVERVRAEIAKTVGDKSRNALRRILETALVGLETMQKSVSRKRRKA